MKVVSTNISEKRIITIGDEQVETGMYKTPVESIYLTKNGVESDSVVDGRYHGGEDMACYLYGRNNYAYFQNLYPDVDWGPGMFGENIEIDILDDSTLNIGDIYKLGEAEVQISQPRLPCSKFGYRLGSVSAIKAFAKVPFPGAYVRVLKEGMVKAGDTMVLVKEQPEKLRLVDLYFMQLNKSANQDKFPSVWNNPHVPEKVKQSLKE